MTGTFCGLPKRMAAVGAGVGAAVACAWLLSPLAVCVGVAMPFLFAGALRGTTPRERRWVAGLLGVALAVRLLALLAFSVFVDYERYHLPLLIGDEMIYKVVSNSLLNVHFGVPISTPDFLAAYSWHGAGAERYFVLLTYLQLLFGLSPFGLHFLNIAYFFAAAVLLYRTARASYGQLPALGGLVVLLFLPTLFVWSISAIKEPLHMLMLAVLVVAALHTVRAGTWARRLAAAGLIAGSIAMLGSLRNGAVIGAIASVFAAYVAVIVTAKRWICVLAMILSFGAAVVAWQSPSVQARALSAARTAALVHMGHVNTPGYSYKLLDQRFYGVDPDAIRQTMTMPEAARFVLRALASFVVVPAPWRATSRSALAFVPQQIVYYLLFVLAAVGCVTGFKRDALLTCLLGANIAVYAAGISLYSGNIGTFVRHRDLVVPMVVWFSALGAATIVSWATAASNRKRADPLVLGATLSTRAG